MAVPSHTDATLRSLLERAGSVPREGPKGFEPLFEEIRGTLRVPFVGGFFRTLALDPPLLAGFWSAAAPALGSRECDAEVLRLIEHSLFVAPSLDLGAEHRAWLEGRGVDARERQAIASVNASVQYACARMLVAAALLRLGLDAAAAPAEAAPRALTPRPRSVSAAAVRPEPVEADPRHHALERRLEALRSSHGHLRVAGYYRALGRWPAYLERAEIDLSTIVGSLRYRACGELLGTLAEVAGRALVAPFRLTPGAGVGGDVLRAAADYFFARLLPDVLMDSTFLRALDSGARAARAPGI